MHAALAELFDHLAVLLGHDETHALLDQALGDAPADAGQSDEDHVPVSCSEETDSAAPPADVGALDHAGELRAGRITAAAARRLEDHGVERDRKDCHRQDETLSLDREEAEETPRLPG